jgi:hypothetical protein
MTPLVHLSPLMTAVCLSLLLSKLLCWTAGDFSALSTFHYWRLFATDCCSTLATYCCPSCDGVPFKTDSQSRAEQSRAEQSRAEAYCRKSAGTGTPGIGPRWDPWPYIYYLYDNYVFSFSCGAPSLRRGRV